MPVANGLPSSAREKFRNWVRPEAGLSKRRWTVPRAVSAGGVKVRVKGVQSAPIG